MWSSLLLLAALPAALGFPATNGHIVHERRHDFPNAWGKATRLSGHEVLPVRIGLTQTNLDKGHDLLMQVSDPSSPEYGQHITADEVHDMFAPADASVTEVRAWLEAEGISGNRISRSANKQWLKFDATAEELERLLRAEYYLHEDKKSGKSHVATREYHVPASLQSHIDYISPGIKTLQVSRRSPKASRGPISRSLAKRQDTSDTIVASDVLLSELLEDPMSLCDRVTTPGCIRAMYNITKGTKATPGNELGIFAALGDRYAQGDLDLAFSAFANEIPQGTQPKAINGIKGAITPPAPLNESGMESCLNFQTAYPLIWPQNTVLYQVAKVSEDDPNNVRGWDWFLGAIDGSYCEDQDDQDCGIYEPTNVISMSYGLSEHVVTARQAHRQCQEYMKLGLQGVSVVAASGNRGAIVDYQCLGPDETVFEPNFPTTCPYITAVGATQLVPGGDPYNPEEVALFQIYPIFNGRNLSTGGGFSNIFERPDWQAEAVEEYLSLATLDLPYYETTNNESFGADGGVYNRIGRAYPDVSVVGSNIFTYARGTPYALDGTSGSAPIFASMLTRINEERLAAGMPTVGFVNPMLYAHPEAFRDITEGYVEGCTGGEAAFEAIGGWDPVGGLGSPVYPDLLKVFMDV